MAADGSLGGQHVVCMAIVDPRARTSVLRRLSLQLLLVFVTVLVLGILVGGITQILEPVINRQTLPADLLIAPHRSSLHPEPVERYSFLVCLLLLPPLLLLLVFSQAGTEPMRRLWIHDRLEFLLVSCTAILLVLPLTFPIGGLIFLDGLVGLAGLALTLVVLRSKGWRLQSGQRKYQKIVVLAFSLLCGLLIVTNNRVFGFAQLNETFAFWNHLDAVTSAVAQAVAGRSLLVDIPSQYGLFPVLLAPWLKLLPEGLMGLTIAFAFLHLISLIALFLVLGSRVDSPLILSVASMALIFITIRSGYSFGVSDGSLPPPDPYFQYFPVRFVAPALSLPVVLWVLKSLSFPRILVLCVWTGICIFWNLDSGVAVLYAVTMLFLLLTGISFLRPEQRVTPFHWRGLLMTTLIIPVGSLSVFAACLGLLSVSAGAPIKLDWLFLSQSIFYRLGFMMIPMSVSPKLWQSLISLYLIALLIGFSRLRSGHSLNSVAPLIVLPLLGAGLFTYYQGRSHDQVFLLVSWPVVMIIALLIDTHFAAIRRRQVPDATLLLPVAGLFTLLKPALLLLFIVQTILGEGLLRLPMNRRQAAVQPPSLLGSELRFIRTYCSDQVGRCALLMKRQGIYSLEAKTGSSLIGPSPVEIILQSDYDRMVQQIRNGAYSKLLIGIQPESQVPGLSIQRSDLFRYQMVRTNPEGTLAFFVRRSHT